MEKYLEELLPARDEILQAMEVQGLNETIPIVTPTVGSFLAQLVSMNQSQSILEIGTAIGYSTLWLARAASVTGGHVTTIDMNKYRREEALQYFAQAGVLDRITSILGDARKVLPQFKDTFDFVFVDAAKGEYLEYLDLVYPLIVPGGILVVDNVLFRGWVVPGSVFEPKYERMVQALRHFLAKLCGNPDFQTSVLPFGDGLAISRKKWAGKDLFKSGNTVYNKGESEV